MASLKNFLLLILTETVLAKKQIHFGAMLPQMHNHDKYTYRSAMTVATALINNDSRILKDYELVLHYRDSSPVLPGLAIVTYMDLMENGPILQALIGPAYSKVTKPIATIATRYNLPQISYAALVEMNTEIFQSTKNNTDRLKKQYPFFLRTTPSFLSFNQAHLKLCKYFGWKKVAIIYEYSSAHQFVAADSLSSLLKDNGITTLTIQGFSDLADSVQIQMDALQAVDARVIIGVFTDRRIICEAYKRNMYGSKYQWIISHGLSPTWYEDTKYLEPGNCTSKHYLQWGEGYITVSRSALRRDGIQMIAKKTSAEIWQMIRNIKKQLWAEYYKNAKKVPTIPESEFYVHSTFAFDAIYLAAIALNKTIPMQGLVTSYGETEKVLEVTNEMLKADFEGVTGRMEYDKYTDERLGEILYRQFKTKKYNYSKGFLETVGYYSIPTNVLLFYEGNGQQLFADGQIVRDGKTIYRTAKVYDVTLLAILWSLTAIGCLLAVVFLCINVYYRNVRMIKMSSPNVNNGIIIGCIMCYISVFLYGLDSRFLSPQNIAVACNATVFTLAVGFTLCFGCLFSKTWRIYKIFTAAKTMKRVAIKDAYLYGIISVLMGIDVLVFLTWMLISPYKLVERNLQSKMVNDVMYSFYSHKCSSEHEVPFAAVLYGYKGLFLLLGLFLAWETRNVTVAVLNDSKFIGIAVYNVCVVSALGVISALALTNTANISAGLILVAISIFVCTTGTLLLVFIPKLRMLFHPSFENSYGSVRSRSATASSWTSSRTSTNTGKAPSNDGRSFSFRGINNNAVENTRPSSLTAKNNHVYEQSRSVMLKKNTNVYTFNP